MIVALSENQTPLLAWKTEKTDGPFFCPECKSEVILKKGKMRQHHFAHTPMANCIYGIGETQFHLRAKREIYEALVDHPCCSKCMLERSIKGCRPDVSLYIDKIPVAIEIQCSAISVEELKRRIDVYDQLGIWSVWVIKDIKQKDEGIYKPTKWQRALQWMQNGRLYIWEEGALVSPIHINPYETWISARSFTLDGETVTAPGYRCNASFPSPRRLHLARDFAPRTDIARMMWLDTLDEWFDDIVIADLQYL